MKFRFTFYVPEEDLEKVKQACFKAGAGRFNLYEQCCWQTLGQGQFKPMEGSQPFLGKVNEVETVEEYKVEMLCTDEVIQAVISAFKEAHPYEEPAYEVYRLEDF